MKITFSEPGNKAPESLLAEASILDCPIPGLSLGGFSVWSGSNGLWVALPGRPYMDNKSNPPKKKSYDYIRSMRGEFRDADKLKGFILAEYEKWAPVDGGQGGPDDSENPFA